MQSLTKKLTQFALITASLFLPQSHSHTKDSGAVQVQIIANPAQEFVACARNVQIDDSAALVAKDDSEPPDKPASIRFITTRPETQLLLTAPSHCTPEQRQHASFSAYGVHSKGPFMAYFVSDVKKTKKRDHWDKDRSESGLFFPLIPSVPYVPYKLTENGGGSFGPDDDDQTHRRPYGYFQDNSGDIDLTLLGGFQLPQVLGDYLPDHTSWQAIMNLMGLGHSDSHTLWVYPENQPEALTSIQVSTEEMEELASNLTGEQPLNWLLPKLRPNHRAVLVQELLALQDAVTANDSVFSETVSELIAQRLAEVLGNSGAAVDLAFERFRLRRDIEEKLDEEVKERLVLAHRPDAEAVYESGEVNKLIYQAGDKPPGSDKAQSGMGKGSAGRSESSSDRGESEEQKQGEDGGEVKSKNGATVSGGSSQRVEPLRIVFFGRMSVGKSSLANLLIGYKHFAEMDGETKGSPGNENGEKDFKTPELTISSLAGYDGWNEDEDHYMERNGIKDSDIIIYVVDGPIKPMDGKYIQYFHDRGQRVVFVRNKYQTAMKAMLKRAGYDESRITDDVFRSKHFLESYHKAIETIKGNFESGYKKSLSGISGIEFNNVPEVLLTECMEEGTFCDANLVARIRSLLKTPEERRLWRVFRDTRVAKEGSINSELSKELKSHIEVGDPGLSLFDFLTMHLTEQYKVPESLLPDKEKVTTTPKWYRAEEIYQKLHHDKAILSSIESEVLFDATRTFKQTFLKTGAISAGSAGVVMTISAILAAMAATPIDEAIGVSIVSAIATFGGWIALPIVGLPVLAAGGVAFAAWYGHRRWQDHNQREQETILSFSGLAVILEMFINESRQEQFDLARWEQYEREHVYDEIPRVDDIIAPTDTQPSEVPPPKPARSKPVSLEKIESEQKNAAMMQTDKRMKPKNHPLALPLVSPIGKNQRQCKTLVDRTADKFREKVLKVLAREPLLLKENPSSEQLFENNFYSHGLIVPLLYGTGIQREQMQEIQYADQIYTTLREGGFSSVRGILEGFLRCTGDCTKLFDAIEVSVARINNPQRFANVIIVSGDKRPMPVIIYEMMADPIKREELVDLAKP